MPDQTFLDARIKIDKTLWAGHIEIHTRSSQWEQHNHHKDASYDNVILHVVTDHDKEIFTSSGASLPTLVIDHRIPSSLLQKYNLLLAGGGWIPCQEHITQTSAHIQNLCIDRMAVERMERKAGDILYQLKINKGDWQETTYRIMARTFGLKVNTDALFRSGMQAAVYLA